MSGLLVSTVVLAALLLLALGLIFLQWRSAVRSRHWHAQLDRHSAAMAGALGTLRQALSSPAAGVGPCLARLADAALLIAEDPEARTNADARGLLEAVDWGLRQLQNKAVEAHALSPESVFPALQSLSSDRRERFAVAFSTLRARHPFDEYDI